MYAPNGSGSQTLDSSSEQKQFTGPVTLLTITLSVLKKPELRDLLRNSKGKITHCKYQTKKQPHPSETAAIRVIMFCRISTKCAMRLQRHSITEHSLKFTCTCPRCAKILTQLHTCTSCSPKSCCCVAYLFTCIQTKATATMPTNHFAKCCSTQLTLMQRHSEKGKVMRMSR